MKLHFLRQRLGMIFTVFFLGSATVPLSGAPLSADVDQWQQKMNDAAKALKNNQLGSAIELCEQAQALAGKFGATDTHLSRSEVLRAEIYMWEKKNDLAERMFAEAVASCERAVGPEHPEVVHPLASMANFYYYVVVRYDRVAVLFERILTIVEHTPQHDPHQEIMWARNLGQIYQQTAQYARAEPRFAQALALAETSAVEWVPHELLNSAAFYRAWGNYAKAELLARRALGLRERALAAAKENVDAELDVAVALDELSAALLAAGKGPEAEQAARRSLSLAESFMTPEQPDLMPRLLELATVLRANGRDEESAALYRRALDLTEKNLGPNSKETGALLSSYATLLREMKKDDEAKSIEARVASIQPHAAL